MFHSLAKSIVCFGIGVTLLPAVSNRAHACTLCLDFPEKTAVDYLIEADCVVQPVMIRYMREGRRDPGITFRENEHFIGNVLRLLGRPASICELRFLAPMQVAGQARKELAGRARALISKEFEKEN